MHVHFPLSSSAGRLVDDKLDAQKKKKLEELIAELNGAPASTSGNGAGAAASAPAAAAAAPAESAALKARDTNTPAAPRAAVSIKGGAPKSAASAKGGLTSLKVRRSSEKEQLLRPAPDVRPFRPQLLCLESQCAWELLRAFSLLRTVTGVLANPQMGCAFFPSNALFSVHSRPMPSACTGAKEE